MSNTWKMKDKNIMKTKNEQTLLNYINAQPNKDQLINTPYGQFKLTQDNWYKETSKKQFVAVCLLSPLVALTAWFWLIWIAMKES